MAREGRPVADAELVAATAAELNAFAAAAAAGASARASPVGPPGEAVGGPLHRGHTGVDLVSWQLGPSVPPGALGLAGAGDLSSAMALVETAGGPASPGPSGRLQCEAWRPLRLPALLVGSGNSHTSARTRPIGMPIR